MLTKQEMLDKLENIIDGVDPKTGEILPDDSILNRIDMLRLFYAIKDYMLDSKTKNNSKKNLAPFKLENAEGIATDEDITITKFVARINDKNATTYMKQLNYKTITSWLLSQGYIEQKGDSARKFVTESGEKIGIKDVIFNSNGRLFHVLVYTHNAQQFILDNIVNGNIDTAKEK